ncbi:ABC transporter permease [Streptomyces sp. NPDC005840]|jgi:ribose/xylose/arabinose/galactoside ABC-type transport system permease subunit|uniref:ABC transporter permease n=1 Tax=Streptomyces doudnae TaxID=3075536 RepID=A0ABD5EII5_9ACTN|nr:MULTISPECIES: ABC transporter permease [unclassified Streptomyces]MDT0433222.1 ABC transporter permease [Streptomyces sp. DSM 41981]MYQ68128.1 ABC transporter permease [Streptomyces sp. SID4950]SCE43287.1 monosaccharide ABC transporter membrane protein, CUT2 family [Streptomyces sp. SolWspMP-5a-2]
MSTPTTAADQTAATGPRSPGKDSARRRGTELIVRFNLVLVFLALCAVASVLAPEFLTTRNMSNLLQQSALTGIVAVGMTLVILTAGIDLSVGSVAAFGGMTVALLIDKDLNFLLAIAVSVAAGAVFGAVMGGLSAYLSLPAFMTTLAGLTAIRGLTYLLTDGEPAGGDVPHAFQLLGGGFVGYVPIVGLIFVAVAAGAGLLLRTTTFGEYIYAVGSNKEAARLSGLPVRAVVTAVFAISGALAALAGVLLTSRLTIGQPTAFNGLELDAIAAVVLGGTNLFGGRGGVMGTFVAVLLLSVLRNLCNLMGLGSFFQMVVTGLILVVALVLNMLIEKRGSRA